MNNFNNKFCENVIYILSSVFREDHLILFNFQLAIMYQRGLNSSENDQDMFNELEWKFFLNQRIDNLNKADCFGDQIYEHKWINILERLINYYNLSDDILAPILNKYQVDIYGQQSETNTPNMSQEDIDNKSKSNSFSENKRGGGQGQQTSKVMSKFKNLIKDKSGDPTPTNQNTKGDHIKHNSNDLNVSNDHGASSFKIQISPAIGVITSTPDNRSIQQSVFSSETKDQERGPANSLSIAYDIHNQNMISTLGLKVREEKTTKNSMKRKSILQTSIKINDDDQSKQSSQLDFGSTVKKVQTQSSFVPQLRELSQQKQIQFGITSYKSFYSILPFLGEQSKLRLIVNSISDHSKEWANYINSSVKVQKRNEEKIQLFREYPNNVLSKISSQQALLVSKYFRPDCLLRYVQLYIRKCFKSVIKITHKTSMDIHVSSQWYKRPTILFFNHMDKSISESLELKATKLQLDSFLVRLNCGFIPIEELCIELENAAGAGSWVIIENMENLFEKEMAYLIRKINQELENSSTTKTFKVWISVALVNSSNTNSHSFKNQDFVCKSEQCSNMMKNLAQSSWKIFLNASANISQMMERLFNIEAQEYKAYRDLKKSQYKGSNQKANLGSGIQNLTTLIGGKRNQSEKILIQKSNIFCGIHRNLKARLNYLNRQGIFNFLSLLNVEHLIAQFPEQQETISHFSQKYRFGLAFVFSVVKYREKCGMPNIFYQTDYDLYYLLDDILQFLDSIPTNPKVFLEKYIEFLYPFQKKIVLNFVKKYVTSAMESMITLKVREDQFQYQLYNFQGTFNNVEEAIIKTLNQYPQEDPLQIVDLSVNQEFLLDYQHSKNFLDKVIEIEKRWEVSKISNILSEIQEFIEHQNEKQQSLLKKYQIHQQQEQQNQTPSQEQSSLPTLNIQQSSKKSRFLDGQNISDDDLPKQQKNFPLVYLENIKRQSNESENLLHLIDSILDVIKLDLTVEKLDLFIFQNKYQVQKEKPIFYTIRDWILLQDPTEDEVVKFKRKEPVFQLNLDQFSYPSINTPVSLQNRNSISHSLALNIPQRSKFTNQDDNPFNDQQLDKISHNEQPSPSSLTQQNSNIPKINMDSIDNFNLQMRKRNNSIYSPTASTPLRSPHLITKSREESSINSIRKKRDSNPYLKLQLQNSFEKEVTPKLQNQEDQSQILNNPESINFPEKPTFDKKDIQLITKTKVPEKLLFSNELLIASSLVYIIRYDLLRIKDYLTLRNDGQYNEDLILLIKALKDNKIPQSWWKMGFFTEENQNVSLINYIKVLLCKLEYIHLIFKNNKCQLTPTISLSKLFDPLGFVQSMILKYAIKFRQNILGVKIVLQKILTMVQETENTEDQIYISGMMIRNGKINKDTLFLEDDNPREFEYPMQQMKLIISSKSQKSKTLLYEKYYEAIIPIELYDTKINMSYTMHDMESDFYNQLLYPPKVYDYADNQLSSKDKEGAEGFRLSQNPIPAFTPSANLLTVNHSRNMSNQNQMKSSSSRKPIEIELTEQANHQINYTVRIPIQNPNTNSQFCQFPAQYYLYIYSKRPQDYWDRRGTKIILNNML